MNASARRDRARHGMGGDTLARVVVASLVVLILVGLVVAVVLVVRDRKTQLAGPVGQSSVTQAVTPAGSPTTVPPTAATSVSPSPGTTPAPATDLDAVAAAVDPGVADLTIKRTSGAVSAGTGIVLTPNGEVLTNDHVIEGALTITATVGGAGGIRTFTGTVLGDDDDHDIALIQLQGASGLQVPVLGTTATVSPGEQVVALGHAVDAGGGPATIPGIVLALDQTIPAVDRDSPVKTLTGVIGIVALDQPSDMGGPVVNAAGQVIGVNVAAAVIQGPASVPVAYAIPINSALQSAEQIREGKTR
jgi:S1-C subfamily serine protease